MAVILDIQPLMDGGGGCYEKSISLVERSVEGEN